MKTYFKLLIICWSIFSIPICFTLFSTVKTSYVEQEHYFVIIRHPDRLTGKDAELRRAVWEEMERRGLINKQIEEMIKDKSDVGRYVEYTNVDSALYVWYPIMCFLIWSIPITVFSLLGILFERRKTKEKEGAR
jgi:hypothetical protein